MAPPSPFLTAAVFPVLTRIPDSIVYNIADTSSAGLDVDDTAVLAGVFSADGSQLVMRR